MQTLNGKSALQWPFFASAKPICFPLLQSLPVEQVEELALIFPVPLCKRETVRVLPLVLSCCFLNWDSPRPLDTSAWRRLAASVSHNHFLAHTHTRIFSLFLPHTISRHSFPISSLSSKGVLFLTLFLCLFIALLIRLTFTLSHSCFLHCLFLALRHGVACSTRDGIADKREPSGSCRPRAARCSVGYPCKAGSH